MMSFLRKWFGLAFAGAALWYFYFYASHTFGASPQVHSMLWGATLLIATAGSLYWHYREKSAVVAAWYGIVDDIIACFLAYVFCFYAWGKIFDQQFSIGPEIMRKTAAELSAFEKAWLFHGHSYRFGLALAGVELVAAGLLLWRRTRTAGTLLYAGITAYITLLDFEYEVVYMQWAALLFCGMSGSLAAADARRIGQFFLNQTALSTHRPERTPAEKTAGIGLRVILLAAVANDCYFFYTIARGG
jgi:hypothetical protein